MLISKKSVAMEEKEKIIAALSEVQHPAISLSLIELGIVRDVEVEGDNVIMTFAFPFPNIPIANTLINSIEKPLTEMGYKLNYIVRVMKEDEKNRFLKLEQEAWKGL